MIHSYTGDSLLADVSYDAFLFSEASTTGAHDYEIMIWLSALGGAEPIGYGTPIASPTIGDYTWDLYEGTNTEGTNTWTVFSFVAPSEITDFAGDINDFFTYLIDYNGVSSSEYLQTIGAGTEPMVLGEAPIYRASDSTLHWVDCLSEPPRLYILPINDAGDAVGEARVVELEDSVTVAFFRKNKPGYIAAYYQGVCLIDEASGKLDVVKEIIPTDQREELRFNDGGVDAKGRFWLAEIDKKAMAYGPNRLPASYGTPRGRLWRYDPDGSLHLMIDQGIVCGNGLGWSPDNKTSEISPASPFE